MDFDAFCRERRKRMPHWRWPAAFLAAGALVCGRSAHAEPTQADKVVARALMAEGRVLRNQGELTAALKRFQGADTIMHVPTTGLEVARTEDAIGRLIEARATARRVLNIPVSRDDPAPFQEARTSAAALVAQLDERIPTIKFVLSDRSQSGTPALWVDEKPITGEIDVPLRLDPGVHQVVARLGKLEASQSIVLRERDYQPIMLRMPTTEEPPSKTSAGGVGSNWRTAGYVGLGVSSAALVTGAVTGALAMSSKRTAEAGCVDSRCPPPTWTDVDRARTYASISTLSFITSAAALAFAVTSLALAPRSGSREQATIHARPRVEPGGVGVEGTF